jgi:protein-S-isoprenylcysteine O-methyltransferase Ste14
MIPEPRTFSPVWLVVTCITTIVFFPLLTLGLAGNWQWVEGWIFSLWFALMIVSTTAYLYLKDPALLAERAQRPGSKNQKPWDKYVLVAIYLIAIVWLVIMPLDAERFGWSPPFPTWIKVAGGLALIPALYLMFQATVENTYMSSLVRIQSDRQQQVVSTGVYGWVRHPLYLGCLLLMIGAPLLLGSVCGLVITGVGIVLLMGRILGEERMLTEELDGYDEYRIRVKRRLLPGIW